MLHSTIKTIAILFFRYFKIKTLNMGSLLLIAAGDDGRCGQLVLSAVAMIDACTAFCSLSGR